MKNNAQALSMNSFKLPNGELKPIEQMAEDEIVKFRLAVAMKKVIENLEVSIQNDRAFSRAKFNVMGIFHELLDEIEDLKDAKHG
jgi:hypothetical protein